MRILIADDAPGAWDHQWPADAVTAHVADAEAAVALADDARAPFDIALLGETLAAGGLAARLQACDPDLDVITWARDARPGLSALVQAIGERRAARRELADYVARAEHRLNHDALTALPNRRAFHDAVAARADGEGAFAVAVLDLDRFRLVNDTLGHRVGDELVRQTAQALGEALPGGMVARLGGDEFGLLFDAVGAPAAAMECERLVRACGAPFDVMGHALEGAACAGLVLGHPGDDPDDLLRRADLALGDAKSQGNNQVCLFDEGLDDALRLRRRIEGGLSQAIERGELAMVFQPIVARDEMEVVGFEALLRWTTEEFGAISPATFIPVAEETRLIHALGDWVLEQSLAAVGTWPGQYVSVNFSPRQFRRPNFVGYIVERCQRAGVQPHRLQIEITETAIFDDVDHAADTLYRLRQMGFRIALDDFGTGYSSLYNIRKFPLDALKIDRTFVDAMAREREAAVVVQAVVHLAQALGLAVIAEGVETRAQIDLLRVAGASHLQGFHFGQPMHAAAAQEAADARYLFETAVAGASTIG